MYIYYSRRLREWESIESRLPLPPQKLPPTLDENPPPTSPELTGMLALTRPSRAMSN